MEDTILEVKNLTTAYKGKNSLIHAVDDVSFEIRRGETVCIVGESGSGKSVTSLSIMRLVEFENGIIENGSIVYDGENLKEKSQEQMRKIRGSEISMIFQEPLTALNPVFSIGKQISEAITLHSSVDKKTALEKAEKLVQSVGISDAKERLKQYPHELSGGMRQRIMIAMALATEPNLLIADEPTTALDVTIEAQILDLLRNLKDERQMSIMLITHDIGVAAEMANRIVVMYAGKIMEVSSTEELFEQPLHPYSFALLESVPKMTSVRGEKLKIIEGSIPSPENLPKGCRFAPRCPFATEKCHQEIPLLTKKDNRMAACWHADELYKNKSLMNKKEV